ncbi:hypothetical protein, partial [Chromohalobacter sp. 48-RD10]|uniref:hypothetical protein n=1 Tax=Chromohalobacter sp. 48-RD10 TaxID=2994063 RepID=UPI00246978D0
ALPSIVSPASALTITALSVEYAFLVRRFGNNETLRSWYDIEPGAGSLTIDQVIHVGVCSG